jgi:hypothetical protein
MSEARLARIEENVLKLVETSARHTAILEELQRERSVQASQQEVVVARVDKLEKEAYHKSRVATFTTWVVPVVISVVIGLSRFI